MFSGLSPTYKGILLALMGYTAFAITDICAKWLSAEYSVYQIIVAQNGIACVLLVAFSPFLVVIRLVVKPLRTVQPGLW